MAHEITNTDGLVLRERAAWHGLGKVLHDIGSAKNALSLAGMDWNVEQWPMNATNGEGLRLVVDSHKLNVRSDTKSPLGVVGAGYTPVQNAHLADIADSLAEGGDTVKVESAGSIRGGRRVWFLLRGESFTARSADEITPYILLANAHDGTMALRAIPTTVRVVCSNTLHMSLGAAGRATGYTFRHTSGVTVKADEIKSALGLYGKSLEKTRERIDVLSSKDITGDQAKAFFTEAYSRDFGAIPAAPKTDSEKSARDRAVEAYRGYSRRWEKEVDIAGGTAWCAMNAYTGWLQHERPVRVADNRKREARAEYRMFGEDADRTMATFDQALSLC